MYPRNAASPPRIAVGPVVQISDGAVQTSGVSVVVRPEGGSETAGGGTVSYGGSSGVVYYAPTQAETDYTAFVVTAYKSGCIPTSVTIVTTASSTAGHAGIDQGKIANPTSTVNLSGTTISTSQAVASVSGAVGSVTSSVTVGTNSDKTGYALTSAYDSAKTAAQAGNQMDLVNAPNSTAVAAIQSGLSTLDAAAVNTEVDTALADYDAPTKAELDAAVSSIRGADSDTLKSLSDQLDGVHAKTTNLPGSPAAVSDITALLTTAMTESYHADGSPPTPAQALFAILQRLTEFSITDTSVTVKKLDGSTTAFVLELNDDTNPSSSTRSS